MSHDLGPDVSFVYDEEGYNYNTVVFQKGKPPLDSELNLVQQLQDVINQRQTIVYPSGWMSLYPAHVDSSLENQFYTQDPDDAKPEYALVNGWVLHVTNTATTTDNANLVDLGTPPSTGNVINGVFLEVWRALLDPDTDTNKPDPATVIDALKDIFMFDENNGWISGENGLILRTENGGQTWAVQLIDTSRSLNGIHFITSSIGWAAGDSGTLARTSSGGVNWTVLTSGTSEDLNSVYAVSQLIGWAVGDSGTILKTTNGISFVAQSSGVTADLNKVYFYDSLTGWVAGSSGTILKTTDGGANWRAVTSGTTQNLNSIFFYDLNFGFAVGDNGTILRTSDGGESWVSQNNNIYTGTSYTSTTEDLRDVFMRPTLDRLVTNEEVSSQMTGSNADFVVANSPVTKGDGNGTTTNDPNDVTVTVNGNTVPVNSVNGTTGTVLLASAPGANDTVKVTYYYKGDCAVFTGLAWIVGTSGMVLRTTDIGAQWIQQTPGTSFDLNAIDFIDENKGWLAGDNSVIRHSEDSGVTWSEQQTDIFIREVQRVYNEGNVDTEVFLNDNSIHPDANVETTKRVQIQYRIRVIDNADPASNPEAGLSSSTLGNGPNTEGTFPYENMGATNGDYGLWRAKCNNTVDGFCYAIPMFFVNRRNTSTFNPESNANGSHQKNSSSVRPDLLVATDVVDSDILDVRHRVVVPSVSEYLYKYLDQLSDNNLQTHFSRESEGGDRWGTELLQIDRIGGTTTDGGTLIANATLAQAVAGTISSEVTLTDLTVNVTAGTSVPTRQILGPVSGVFHTNPTYFKAVYNSPGSGFDGKPVPGYFEGYGSSSVTFVFDQNANTTTEDPSLATYDITGTWIDSSGSALTRIPSQPKLVENFSGAGSASFYYHGIADTEETSVIETWDSGIPDNPSYAQVYVSKDSSNTTQRNRSSSIEVHHFMRVTDDNTDGIDKLIISRNIFPDPDDVPYSIYTVSKINNIDSGFSYKIDNIVVGTTIEVESVDGFPFIVGTVVEVIAQVLSETGDANVRNGASVNFNPRLKRIDRFSKSVLGTGSYSVIPASLAIPLTGTEILGVSTTETEESLTDPFCWVGDQIYPVTVSGFGTSTLSLTIGGSPPASGDVTIQIFVRETALTYPDDTGSDDGLLIGYNYIPYQSQSDIPTSLSLDVVTLPPYVIVSNLGTGGGTMGDPYLTPIEHIPVNDSAVTTENYFHNTDPLRFANFKIDSGFVRLPVKIPGSFGGTITLSSPTEDLLGRLYYAQCSKEFSFVAEGLQIAVPRKVYLPVIARVNDPSNTRYVNGEYVMVVFSRNWNGETDNSAGFEEDSNSVIAVYRIPNKPMSRI